MCSYACTCFCYRQFLFIYMNCIVLCCIVLCIVFGIFRFCMNAFFCYCCWNCLYLSFSSYRDNLICCCCYCRYSYYTLWIKPQSIQFHFFKKNWIHEWGHSHFLPTTTSNAMDDGIESRLFALWHFIKPLKLIGIAQCTMNYLSADNNRTKPKSENFWMPCHLHSDHKIV